MKLIGIIQCDFAKERCSGFACINSFTQRIDAFSRYPKEIEMMAVPFNCGGCPGRRIGRLVEDLIKRAKKAAIERDEIILHLASCMVTDNAHYPPCPHLNYIEKSLERKGIQVKKGSYKGQTAQKRRDEGLHEAFEWEDVQVELKAQCGILKQEVTKY